ncbi:MAG: NAD-dependent epimerase/dehydratase family protein [Actinomycetota bacterium]|nr:NAD-dependent epimerase/dehydratase family protein [Actinomycetota bacterium]
MRDNATVLITGGTGFIGSYLAMALLERDKQVRVTLSDRDPDLRRVTGFEQKFEKVKDRVAFVQGDLTILNHVLELFDQHQPASVYHLGALLSAGAEANPTMGFQTDLVGTWNVLEAARLWSQTSGRPPVKVLFPSTIASFGDHIPPELRERVPNEAPQMPQTMYGVAKVASERLGEYYHRRRWVDFRGVRFPSVIGASRGPGGTTVYATLMVQLPAQGLPYQAYVKPDQRLDVIYVKDAVRALIELHDADDAKLGSSDSSFRRVYNIAGIRDSEGRAPTAQAIAQAVAGALGQDLVTFNEDPALTKIVSSFGILDASLAQKDWGWQGQFTDLDAAVANFVNDVQAFPKRLKRLELFGA